MANVLASDKKLAVIHQLVEGSSIRSTERLTGVHRDTICRLLVKVGDQRRDLLDERMRGLKLNHIQVDEIWTFCRKKQARLTIDEQSMRHDIGDIYFWVAFDQSTKLIPTFVVGKRSADNARRLMMDLASRLVWPSVVESDARNFHGSRWLALPDRDPTQHGRIQRVPGGRESGLQPVHQVRHDRQGFPQRGHAVHAV